MNTDTNYETLIIGGGCAILASITFSGKTIIVKLAYQHGVDVLTLLALRMLFSLPFFLFMAWWAGAAHLSRRDWVGVIALGFTGYYVGSYLGQLCQLTVIATRPSDFLFLALP